MITLISPADKSSFSMLSPAQKKFIENAAHMTAEDAGTVHGESYKWLDNRVTEASEASCPASLIIKWKASDPLHLMKVHLALDEDFTVTERIGTVSPIFASAEDGTHFAVINNLLSGTEYYWKISVGDEESEARSFATVRGEMRTIRAEGAGNIRDMGGRYNMEGKRIRQGLLYRGAQMNDLLCDENAKCNGLGVLRDDLGIKTDIDLRFEALGKYEFCPLGDHVKYKLFTADAYEGIFKEGQDELFREVLELIADEENYPVYFHCVAGADRTGSVAFFLDAILGLSDEEIIKSYNLTALSETRCWYTNVRFFIRELNERYPDLPLREQLMRMIREYICLSEETINKLRRNLLEE